MSVLRLAPRRPLAALCGASSRAFSTTCARNSDPTRDLMSTLQASSFDRENTDTNRDQPSSRLSQQLSRKAVANTSSPSSQHKYARNLLQENLMQPEASTADEIDISRLRTDLEIQSPRRWQYGDVYAPHDLTGVEAKKWKKTRRAPEIDAFDTLGLDPLKEYKNFSIMSEYVTEMGRIKHSRVTGLKPRNHRKLAKAIRRAIGIGIMPSVHIHPELIKPSHGAAPGAGN